MSARSKLLIASWLLAVASLGLAFASIAILSPAPDLRLASGRHLLAGALANVSLAAVLIALALGPVRRGHLWAISPFLLSALLYGVPILVTDARNVASEHRLATLAPQLAGLACLALGIALAFSGARAQTRASGLGPRNSDGA